MSPASADSDSTEKDNGAPDKSNRRLAEIEATFKEFLGALPELDHAALEGLAAEVKSYPANAYPMFLDKLSDADTMVSAMAFLVLRQCGDAELKDRLSAALFDFEVADKAKVRRNELLTELGLPVDSDLLEMSVANAVELAAGSSWKALRSLDAGDIDAAMNALATLDAGTRAILIHTIGYKQLDRAIPVLEAMLGGEESDMRAAADAVCQINDEAVIPMLARLAESSARDIQKAAKRSLFALRGGVDIPEESTGEAVDEAEKESPPGKGELPLHRAVVARSPDGNLVVVAVAREYPNGRLKALITIVDFWRRGIYDARYRINMSRAEFKRYLRERFRSDIRFEDAAIEECCQLVARGLRVAREMDTKIPFDFQGGKDVLGDVAAAAAAIKNPFLCSDCGAELDTATIAEIKDAAGYDLPAETRCEKCRGNSGEAK